MWSVVLLMFVALCGCNSATNDADPLGSAHGQPSTTKKGHEHITKMQAIEIVKSEVMKRGWSEIEIDEPKSTALGGWIILVWRLPKTPGGHAVIEISPFGDIVATIPGA